MAAAKEKPKAAPAKPKVEKAELVKSAYTVFGVTPEVMQAALTGVDAATVEEAEKKVKVFLSKGVSN